MASSTFKRADRRFFAGALSNDLTHGGLDVYESGLELKTEGNKDQRATAIVGHLFDDIEHSDPAVLDMLNHLYVDSAGSDFLLKGEAFQKLKTAVLDPRGVVLGDDGFFLEGGTTIHVASAGQKYQLQAVGEGAFALVSKYRDDDYLIHIAVKQLKRNSSKTELQRFKAEFDVLKRLNHPYVLTVFKYDDQHSRYTMEFCDSTLGSYIDRNNSTLSFATRKRIVLQFLYGINYLDRKSILHRDLSHNNVLLKIHDDGAVTVKLADFGLHKTQGSTATQTGTAMKGTIIDPMLADFKSYSLANEIYSVGRVISFIFTGRRDPHLADERGQIIRRCIDNDLAARYQSITDIIRDVESLHPTAASTPTQQ